MSDKLLTPVKNALELTRNDDRGATMIEYGLLVALIAVVVIPVLLVLGPRVANLFQTVINNLP
ncbi:MAG TPA: Flp family type IVb pilin [Kribbella sp.]